MSAAVETAVVSRDEAQLRAHEIRMGLMKFIDTLDKIAAAYRDRDWVALGYESWDAYLAGEFGEERLRLPREDRMKAVEALRLAGLSTRAIGTTLGVSTGTVHADLAGVQYRTPAEVVGADGKTYAASKPRRDPGRLSLRYSEKAGWVVGPVGGAPFAHAPRDVDHHLDAQAWAAERIAEVEHRQVTGWENHHVHGWLAELAPPETAATAAPAPAAEQAREHEYVEPDPSRPSPGDPVWVAALRRGVEAHRPVDDAATACGRSMRTGHDLTAADVRARFHSTWCPRCWPTTPDEVPEQPQIVWVAPAAGVPGGPVQAELRQRFPHRAQVVYLDSRTSAWIDPKRIVDAPATEPAAPADESPAPAGPTPPAEAQADAAQAAAGEKFGPTPDYPLRRRLVADSVDALVVEVADLEKYLDHCGDPTALVPAVREHLVDVVERLTAVIDRIPSKPAA